MNTPKMLIPFFAMFLMLGTIVPAARADEEDQATKLTFSQAVEVPGHVLPAGTYWFVLADTDISRNVVEIFNQDRSQLIATVQTIDSYRQEPAGSTIVSFAERPAGQPEALRTWYYPGRENGHEFLYSGQEERELSHDTKVAVTATPSGSVSDQPVSGD